MKKNVGMIDRLLRFLLAIFLIWLGLFQLDGIHGSVIGILIAACSFLPLVMATTASCFVFRWFNIHSLSKKEQEKYADINSKEEN